MSDETKPVTFRCPIDLLDSIDKDSKAERRSRTDQILIMLEREIGRRLPESAPKKGAS